MSDNGSDKKSSKAAGRSSVLDAALGLTSLGSPKSSPAPSPGVDSPKPPAAAKPNADLGGKTTSPRRSQEMARFAAGPDPARKDAAPRPGTDDEARMRYLVENGGGGMGGNRLTDGQFRTMMSMRQGGPGMGPYWDQTAMAMMGRAPPPSYGAADGMLPPLPTPSQLAPVSGAKSFPESLYDIISAEESNSIISWLPHGKGFVIHDKKRFEGYILPKFFDNTKYTSFTRRLKRWNFVRVPRGPEMGAYYNRDFVRDMPHLVQKMRYRLEGQFAQARGSDGKGRDERMLEEMLRKEVAAQAREEAVRAKVAGGASPRQAATDVYEKDASFSVGDNRPMPLPSAIPRKGRGMPKHPYPGFRDYTVDPSLITPDEPDRRMMELQNELLMTRSMLNDHRRQHDYMQSKIMNPDMMAPPLYRDPERSMPMGGNMSMGGMGGPMGGNMMGGSMPMGGSVPIGGMMKKGSSDGSTGRGRSDSGERPIMMSTREQEEFADFLAMKRRAGRMM